VFYVLVFALLAGLLVVAGSTVLSRNHSREREESRRSTSRAERRQRKASRSQSRRDRRKRR